jgi:hypothetical protein
MRSQQENPSETELYSPAIPPYVETEQAAPLCLAKIGEPQYKKMRPRVSGAAEGKQQDLESDLARNLTHTAGRQTGAK